MRFIKRILAPVFILALLSTFVYAQPSFKRKDIPEDIESGVRTEIIKLFSKNVARRRSGAYNLGKMGAKANPAIPYLVAMLSDRDKMVRWSETAGVKTHIMLFVAEDYATALAEIGEASFNPLVEALKSDDNNVKMYAASALGHLKDERAVGPLASNLDDQDERVKKFTAKALKDITGKDFGDDKKKWESYLKGKK
jgi:hypothetical protein